jgi:hypothetical protein
VRAWSAAQNPTHDDREEQNEDGDELDKLECADLDISGEADGDNGGIVDDEPSLGSLDGRMSQLRWGAAGCAVLWPNSDLEHDEAESRRWGGLDVPIEGAASGPPLLLPTTPFLGSKNAHRN